ncbi:MAG: ATP-dependent protease ATPase subunit HslU [Phycisphaerales bacterium]|nr:ATP-dependent protease ATPase subunit HslU [Phycisphaerales bacterium]
MTPRELTPRQIVAELDKYIIGQRDAKRAVAIAVRNRWRRQRLQGDLAREVSPRNIIMVGPTGVGKTEIARRLARLVDAPFIKIEATKFTEVGYHGRDVDSMIRDLLDLAIKMVRNEQAEIVKVKAQEAVEQRLVSILLGREPSAGGYIRAEESELGGEETSRTTRDRMLERLRQGVFDDREIELSVRESASVPLIGGMGPDQLDPGVSSMLEQLMPARHKMRKVSVTEARRILLEEETDKLIDRDLMISEAIARTEQSGIIFLDEIDKIAAGSKGTTGSADVSRQGVQRDLLPIVEGSSVATRHGMVQTDHILFIAAGAFHSATVSDLMPELQGRFPIRVELAGLTRDDFVRILREPDHSLLKQQKALLETEGLTIEIDDDAIDTMADIAARANSTMENIGARRLMTIVERLFENISFDAPDMPARGETQIRISAAMVREQLESIVADEDLSRFVL